MKSNPINYSFSIFLKCIILVITCIFSFSSFSQEKITLYAYENKVSESKYNPICMPCTDSREDAGTIAFTKYWKIVYVPNQSYLGRVVLTSVRHFAKYEDMNKEESDEYQEILDTLLPAIQKAFNVTHFNVAFLMNMAYNKTKPEPKFKNGKPNPHFHWHIIPRYDSERSFAGEVFTDPDFGDSFNLKRKQVLVGNFRDQAIKAIQKNLKIKYINN